MRDDYIDFLVRVHAEADRAGARPSSTDARITVETTPWDFDREVRDALRTATDAVDVGTGDGERLVAHLAAIGDDRPHLLATEGWPENVPVATAALAGASVPVLEYDPEFGDVFPLPDAAVDLLVTRHEAVDAAEFARVLRPGGRLITEQVDGDDAPELREWFGGEALYPEITLANIRATLERAGFRIDQADDATMTQRFRDVPTLVEYLAKAPWEVADFDVREHAAVLRDLADRRPIDVSRRRFHIIATKI